MTNSETKICRKCFSTIDARARKCPACHSYLGSAILFAPALAVLAVGLALAMLAGLVVLLERRQKYQFENHATDVSIVDSEFYLGPPEYPEAGNELLCPIVVGRLKNNGAQELGSIGLQVESLNAEGALIDVYEEYVRGPFKPGEEYAFKVRGQPIHLPQANYAEHNVIVRNAFTQ